MKNQEIRAKAKAAGVKLWQIADKLQISEPTMTRRMRRELPESEKKQIFAIIEELKGVDE